jgi:hypothetical protein
MVSYVSSIQLWLLITFNFNHGLNHIMHGHTWNQPELHRAIRCNAKSELLHLRGGYTGWDRLHEDAIREETELRSENCV